ncbi:MAG: site-specific integrase [Gammaproteobacteria bacterium]|nr:site-specific integrase [Gammaproteobacteria bacterium]
MDDAIPLYLSALASQGRSRHTLRSFELDLRLLRGQLGNRPVGTIELRHLRQFIAWVRLTRENSPNSLRRKVATLKSFFGFLHEEGFLRTHVADPLPYPEAYVALPEFLENDAAQRLVEVAEGNTFWRALLLLLLDTGLKRDEVLALRTADVSLGADEADAGYLVVRETDAAKRLRSRKIPLTERLRDALREHMEPASARVGESRVFDVSVRGINFIVETCGRRAGIVTGKPRLTPQVLRETFAVAQMWDRVREEQRCKADGWRDEALQLLALRHDAQVLEMLGLKDDPDTARKYRMLVRT